MSALIFDFSRHLTWRSMPVLPPPPGPPVKTGNDVVSSGPSWAQLASSKTAPAPAAAAVTAAEPPPPESRPNDELTSSPPSASAVKKAATKAKKKQRGTTVQATPNEIAEAPESKVAHPHGGVPNSGKSKKSSWNNHPLPPFRNGETRSSLAKLDPFIKGAERLAKMLAKMPQCALSHVGSVLGSPLNYLSFQLLQNACQRMRKEELGFYVCVCVHAAYGPPPHLIRPLVHPIPAGTAPGSQNLFWKSQQILV